MSGIAEVLLNLGYKVTGSDVRASAVTEHLKKKGAVVFIGHKRKNIGAADVVVTSTAVSVDNPEVVEAKRTKVPVIPRIEMLAELARLKYTISIAGTHGKTTTTSLASLVLERGGLDPTVVIGGRLKNLKSGAKLGKGDFLVAEADESDGSFLKLSPTITVVTNIDNDHLDYYHSIDNIKKAFLEHINRIPFYGCAILCSDDKNVSGLIPFVKRPYKTYGFNDKADFTAKDIKARGFASDFLVKRRGEALGRVLLSVPGRHNILNSLAAIAVGMELEIPFRKIAAALKEFGGVGRRLEIKGEKNGITIIDDYGHHPTEIQATLNSIKMAWPERRLVVLFQPHRYTRTKFLAKEFGPVFGQADRLKLLDIYPAGEQPIKGVTSRLIAESVQKSGKRAEFYEGVNGLSDELTRGDIVLTLGAGDVWKIGEQLLEKI
jgi:UDP-N-acetylmuramate--alanine ligase